MEIILQQAEILHSETLFRDDFDNNLKNWETVKNDDEQAFIKDGYYWMENTSNSRWMYYKTKLPLNKKDDFLIDTEIEILSKNEYGHVGLVWGFGKGVEVLNRFTVSADGKRVLVMQFDKNHHREYHRFHSWNLKPSKEGSVRLSIAKIDGYFYFLHNGNLVYSCHISHFADDGPYIGFYVEPGILIRSSYIETKRLITKKEASAAVFEKLLS